MVPSDATKPGLRANLRALREPRYAALSALMAVVALACIGAGTWQIIRFEQKVHANDVLTANAHAAPAPVGDVLPLTTQPAPSTDAVRYRPVTASGHYDPAHQGLVRLRSVNGTNGFYVLTPLVTKHAVLLVARGFVAQQADGSPPAKVAAPPAGTVSVSGRVQTGESQADLPSGIPAGQLRSINPSDQAQRLRRPVYNGSIELLAGQPGTHGLTPIPAPGLSNPAGGAIEPQHFAYIIQWYLFAMLAVAAPFAMMRADRRERHRTDEHELIPRAADAEPEMPATPQDVTRPEPPVMAQLSEAERRAAKLADRYGRPV